MATTKHRAELEFEGRFAGASAAFDQLKRKVRETDGEIGSSNARSGASFGQLALAIGGVVLAYRALTGTMRAVSGIVTSGIGEFVKLETAMAEVATISTEVAENMPAYRDLVEGLARTYGIDAAEVAKGLYETISAGVSDASDATIVLTESLRFGIAALVDSRTSVDLMTTVLNSYRLEVSDAARVSDLLFKTIELGKITGPQLAGSLGRVTPVAFQAKVELEELLGVLALLTRGGLSTDEAVTALRAVLISVIQPTKESREAAEALGLTLFNTRGLAEQGLLAVLEELAEKSEGNVETAAILLPNIRALIGALATIGQMEDAPEIMNALANATGATDRAVSIFMGTWQKFYERFKETWDQLKSRVGEGFLEAIGKDRLEEVRGDLESFLARVDVRSKLFSARTADPAAEDYKQFFADIAHEFDQTLGQSLPKAFGGFIEAILLLLQGLGALLDPMWDTLKASAVEAFRAMGTAAGQAFIDALKAMIAPYLAFLEAFRAPDMGSMINFPGGGEGSGMATGGLVRGASGVDAVPIRATAGEFVVREDVVSAIGSSFFEALNSLPPREIRNVFPNVRSGEGAGLITDRMASGSRRMAVAGGFR